MGGTCCTRYRNKYVADGKYSKKSKNLVATNYYFSNNRAYSNLHI